MASFTRTTLVDATKQVSASGKRLVEFESDPLVPHDLLLKCLVIGDSGVGKSSLTKTFTEGQKAFSNHFVATIGVDYSLATFLHGCSGKRVKMQLWDTAGQERFRAITRAYYRGAHGVIIAYDRTDAESMNNINLEWLPEVKRHSPADIPVFVIGNKSDLEERIDAVAEGALFERLDLLGIPHAVTSAKTGFNIDKAFLAHIDSMVSDRASRADVSDRLRREVHLNGRSLDDRKGYFANCCTFM